MSEALRNGPSTGSIIAHHLAASTGRPLEKQEAGRSRGEGDGVLSHQAAPEGFWDTLRGRVRRREIREAHKACDVQFARPKTGQTHQGRVRDEARRSASIERPLAVFVPRAGVGLAV